MSIRRAAAADVPAAEAIVQRAYATYVERIGRRPAPMDDDLHARARAGHLWVAEIDGTPVGTLVLVPRPDHLHVESVAVDPGRQGEGLGRALLAHAEREAAGAGLSELRLYTNEAMTENLALYPRLGYREVGRRTEDGFRRVFFAKAVTAARRAGA